MSDFYTFLPSNASFDLFPENKTSCYKIQLAQRMELTGAWQAALVEIHYPNTIQRVSEGENIISLTYTTPEQNVKDKYFYVKPGYYSREDDFLSALHDALRSLETLPSGNEYNSVVEITQGNFIKFNALHFFTKGSLAFSPRLALQLGLPHPGPFPIDNELCGENPVDLALGIPPQLYVYLDKVSEQIVGDSKVPLLRAVPTVTDGRYGSMSVHRFEQPLCFDLATKSFDSVEVNIRDHTGRLVSFAYGTSMLLVHFRKN